MAAAAMAEAHMEELVEQSEAAEDREAQLRELYHDGPLFAPEVDFIVGQYRVLLIHYIWFNCMKPFAQISFKCFRARAFL